MIRLTPFVDADAPVLRDGDADRDIRFRFDFPNDFIPSIEHSLAVIARWREERDARRRFAFAARDAEIGTLLGGCELFPTRPGVANLSYWTYPPHRNRGVATRAVALAIRFAFRDLEVERLEILIDPDNEYPRKVALHNGFEESDRRDGRVLYVLDIRSLDPEPSARKTDFDLEIYGELPRK